MNLNANPVHLIARENVQHPINRNWAIQVLTTLLHWTRLKFTDLPNHYVHGRHALYFRYALFNTGPFNCTPHERETKLLHFSSTAEANITSRDIACRNFSSPPSLPAGSATSFSIVVLSPFRAFVLALPRLGYFLFFHLFCLSFFFVFQRRRCYSSFFLVALYAWKLLSLLKNNTHLNLQVSSWNTSEYII